jgi:hypothetical protein
MIVFLCPFRSRAFGFALRGAPFLKPAEDSGSEPRGADGFRPPEPERLRLFHIEIFTRSVPAARLPVPPHGRFSGLAWLRPLNQAISLYKEPLLPKFSPSGALLTP